jgi:hypothetical protein
MNSRGLIEWQAGTSIQCYGSDLLSRTAGECDHGSPSRPQVLVALHYNRAQSTLFTYFTKDTLQGNPHGLYFWQALIATHLRTSMSSHLPHWKTPETCAVQGCSKALDAAGHHRASCSRPGWRAHVQASRLHGDVAHWLAQKGRLCLH